MSWRPDSRAPRDIKLEMAKTAQDSDLPVNTPTKSWLAFSVLGHHGVLEGTLPEPTQMFLLQLPFLVSRTLALSIPTGRQGDSVLASPTFG